VQQRAKANTYENFSLSIREKVEGLMIDRMDRNQDIVSKFLNEDDFKSFPLATTMAQKISLSWYCRSHFGIENLKRERGYC